MVQAEWTVPSTINRASEINGNRDTLPLSQHDHPSLIGHVLAGQRERPRESRMAATPVRAVLPADASDVLAAASRQDFLTMAESLATMAESLAGVGPRYRKGEHRLPATFNL